MIQLVQANGTVLRAPYSVAIPVDRQTKLVAGGTAVAYLRDSTFDGVHVRVLTAPLGQGLAVQVLRIFVMLLIAPGLAVLLSRLRDRPAPPDQQAAQS